MAKSPLTEQQMRLFEKPSLSCRDIRTVYGDRVDNDLPRSLADRVDEHVAGCTSCQEFDLSYKLVIRLAKEISPPAKLSTAAESRLLSNLRNRLGY